VQQQQQRRRQQQQLELWCYRWAVPGAVEGIGRGSVADSIRPWAREAGRAALVVVLAVWSWAVRHR